METTRQSPTLTGEDDLSTSTRVMRKSLPERDVLRQKKLHVTPGMSVTSV